MGWWWLVALGVPVVEVNGALWREGAGADNVQRGEGERAKEGGSRREMGGESWGKLAPPLPSPRQAIPQARAQPERRSVRGRGETEMGQRERGGEWGMGEGGGREEEFWGRG